MIQHVKSNTAWAVFQDAGVGGWKETMRNWFLELFLRDTACQVPHISHFALFWGWFFASDFGPSPLVEIVCFTSALSSTTINPLVFCISFTLVRYLWGALVSFFRQRLELNWNYTWRCIRPTPWLSSSTNLWITFVAEF